MSSIRIGRNAKCPCKSGKKFKQCCLLTQGPKRLIGKPKKEHRAVPALTLSNEQKANTILQQRLEQFKQRFRRNPVQADGVFFQAENVETVVKNVSKAMESSGLDPAFIYAFQKTGLIVVSENMDALTGNDLQLWQDAVDEYRSNKVGEQHAEPQLDHDK